MNWYRINVTAAIVLAAAATTAWAATARTVEQMALEDFAASNGALQRNAEKAIVPLRLDETALALNELQDGVLLERAETLRFVWREEEVEGFVITTADRPMRIAGKNRATDLAQLYQQVAAIAENERIRYLEMEGQGAFAVLKNGSTVVYLSRSAAEFLELPAREALSLAQLRQAYEKRR